MNQQSLGEHNIFFSLTYIVLKSIDSYNFGMKKNLSKCIIVLFLQCSLIKNKIKIRYEILSLSHI